MWNWLRCLVAIQFVAALTVPGAPRAQSAPPDVAASHDDPALAGRYRGRVVGPDGQPVGGARVYLTPMSEEPVGKQVVRATTDAAGHFDFDAPDMTFADSDGLPARRKGFLSAAADGYAPDWLYTWDRQETLARTHRNAGDQDSFELRLAPDDVTVRGRLLDLEGRPLVGALVRLRDLYVPKGRDLDAHLKEVSKRRGLFGCSPGYERMLAQRPHLLPETIIETRTDADGQFSLPGLGRDRLATIKATAPGIIDTDIAVMTRERPEAPLPESDAEDALFAATGPGLATAHFTRRMDPGRTIEGRVIDRETRQPIAGMHVGTGREGYPRDGVLWRRTETDADGRFKISGLDPATAKWHLTAASAPGMAYLPAAVVVEDDKPVVIEASRAIPFRLKLVDDAGRPVNAKVEYFEVLPNPQAPKYYCYPTYRPMSVAAKTAEGIYQGFAVPGPGAVLVTAAEGTEYLPPRLDPKAFFAPGRTEWTDHDRIWTYGTTDTVATPMGGVPQENYAAIVLVNPEADEKTLELSATVARGGSRQVTLVDAEGKPVVGASTFGMTRHAYDAEPPLRAAAFKLRHLHPQRVRRVTFFEPDRKLIGFLKARGDGDTPYTVRLEPWGEVTGQILSEKGEPAQASLSLYDWSLLTNPDSDVGDYCVTNVDPQGRFRIERLTPGLRYSARIYRPGGQFSGMAFENLVVRPGEVRDLGAIRIKPGGIAAGRSHSHLEVAAAR